ncbi:MAG: urea carboxylase [Alcanivoracaceae bacterium]|nr:urea carboxylase [Alcanivoracaceae bacterium]
MLTKVLIANRGEIAVRIIRTLRRLGIASVAVYSDADRNSMHVREADEAVHIGGSSAAESYLQDEAIIDAAKKTGAQAIIPGYGFLSENAEFAEACAQAGIIFVGPTPTQLRQFGLKHEARALAQQAGVPLTPGTGLLKDINEAVQAASEIGYPVMLKSTAGGGGIGLSRCDDEPALCAAFESVQRLGQSFFSDGGVFIERFIDHARHIEVQIFGDGNGNVIALGERDCSIQRRNQKVVEETPAPGLPASTRDQLMDAAVSLGASVKYQSAGTVEFIYDGGRDEFYFLEVNTRLQVEHGITEAVTGVDLVEWMLLTAAGAAPDIAAMSINPVGASIEVRLYAEDPVRNFQPSPGTLTEVSFPDNIRVDGWVDTGTEVSAYYDPMLAKLIVYGADRDAAIAAMRDALDSTRICGIASNLDYLRCIIASEAFIGGDVSTRYLDSFAYAPLAMEVLSPGTYTTIQDYPGRTGYWHIGVPPSGPMDDYAFRLANRIVGNDAAAAALECTIIGPSLRFHSDALIALTGAQSQAMLDGEPVPFWQPVTVLAGQVLNVGKASSGCRTYLAVRNGVDVPEYLGSKATFALGQFGGHAGRPLRNGDLLEICQFRPGCPTPAPVYDPAPAPQALLPEYSSEWDIAVLYGPHGAPDFFTAESIDEFFASPWEVHYNSNRLGIRLSGPKPTWTRSDGGEAGLHPSNIHDCEYAIGSINFTGDMPVILTRDGPSLGGFVCPVTICKAELWKVGQVKPGDRIRFRRIGFDEAAALERAQDSAIESLLDVSARPQSDVIAVQENTVSETVLAELPAKPGCPSVAYRQAGDRYVLIEYGENILDLTLRFRIHALMQALEANPVNGIIELSPGVRSLQVNYDSRVISQKGLIETLLDIEQALPPVGDMKVATRIIRLPLAFEDSATLDAVSRYRQSVRDKAPWLPNNVEFIRRINGLDSIEQVSDIIYDASYMVLGLGDVYLGAPCAVPVDPRHRLLTSKYNPARTFTAEGTVGIGGVYMCIYGMDSPGGYQLVGRTLPIWNKFLKNETFVNGKPWLLRFFDQVRFYPVSEEELTGMREAFREGALQIDIVEEEFDLGAYQKFLDDIAPQLEVFKEKQKAAFDEEVALWNETGAHEQSSQEASVGVAEVAEGCELVSADISGNIWKLLVEPGQKVAAGDTLVIIEAMKMEFAVYAPADGIVQGVHCAEGRIIQAGDALVVIEATSV